MAAPRVGKKRLSRLEKAGAKVAGPVNPTADNPGGLATSGARKGAERALKIKGKLAKRGNPGNLPITGVNPIAPNPPPIDFPAPSIYQMPQQTPALSNPGVPSTTEQAMKTGTPIIGRTR